MRCLVIMALLVGVFNVSSVGQQGRVLLIGMDGCRSDALIAANTPNLDALIATGSWSPDALNIPPTWSGTGWSSMLTGVWPGKHGVTDNSFSNSNFVNYPHFYNHVENSSPTLQTESIVHWGPIHTEIMDLSDYELIVGTDAEVRDNAIDRLSNYNPDALFLHFDDIDHAGHLFGFLPTQSAYLDAIEVVDTQIGEVLVALQSRPNYIAENWLVLVSTDHGGTASGHGGSSIDEQKIFIIASGGTVPAGIEVLAATSTYNWSNSFGFNGANYAVAANPSVGDFGIGDFTVECWINTTGWSGDPSIISNKNWASGNNTGFVLAGNTNGTTWKVNVGDGGDRVDLNGGVINDGLWHHLAFSCDRDGLMSIYQDGRLMGQETMTSIGNMSSGLDFCIAQDGTGTYPDFWPGAIAEVRLWDIVISDEDIASEYCSQLDLSHPDYAFLRSHWLVDEGFGVVFGDDQGVSNLNVIGGASWTASNNVFNCVDYSGTPRITDLAPTALKHLGISIDLLWDLDGDCFGVLPPVCSINGFSLGIQTGCAALTGDYLQELFIDYSNPDQHLQIDLNGSLFDISNGEDRFLLSGLLADGNAVNIDASIPADPACNTSFSVAFIAPPSCEDDCPSDINNDEIVNAIDLLLMLAAFASFCP